MVRRVYSKLFILADIFLNLCPGWKHSTTVNIGYIKFLTATDNMCRSFGSFFSRIKWPKSVLGYTFSAILLVNTWKNSNVGVKIKIFIFWCYKLTLGSKMLIFWWVRSGHTSKIPVVHPYWVSIRVTPRDLCSLKPKFFTESEKIGKNYLTKKRASGP